MIQNFESKYSSVGEFVDGVAVVSKTMLNEHLALDYKLYGLIDEQGKEVIPCEFLRLRYEDGLARMKNDDLYIGCFDKHGNEVVPFSRKYRTIGAFSKDLARVSKDGVPKSQAVINLVTGDDISARFYRGRGPLRCYGYIDMNGNEVIPAIYTIEEAGLKLIELRQDIKS